MEPRKIDATHYEISSPTPIINFNFFGCGGTGVQNGNAETTPQYRVGAALAQQQDALCTFILGDMFYNTNPYGKAPNDGLHEPRDEKWKGSFQAPYKDLKNPVFAAIGNHEVGAHNTKRHTLNVAKTATSLFKIIPGAKQRLDTAIDSMMPTGDDLAKFFFENDYAGLLRDQGLTGPTLITGRPGYYVVSIRVPDQGRPAINVFVLNSNTLPHDTEQQAWLRDEMARSEAQTNIIYGHQPVATYNKLYFKDNDIACYGYTEEDLQQHPMQAVRSYFARTTTRNFNDLYAISLIESLGEQITKVDIIGAAHAHQQAISTLNDHPLFSHLNLPNKLVQFIVGSGGGKLQHFEWFGHQTEYFAKQFGFINFTYDSKQKSYNAKYITPEPNVPLHEIHGQLLTEFRFNERNEPEEFFNRAHGNQLGLDVDEAIKSTLRALYGTDLKLRLSGEFTDLLESVHFMASDLKLELALKKSRINVALTTHTQSWRHYGGENHELRVLRRCLEPHIKMTKADIQSLLESLTRKHVEPKPELFNTPFKQELRDMLVEHLTAHNTCLQDETLLPQVEALLLILITSTETGAALIQSLRGTTHEIENEPLRDKLFALYDARIPTNAVSDLFRQVSQNDGGRRPAAARNPHSLMSALNATYTQESRRERDPNFKPG